MNTQIIDIADPLWTETLAQLHHDIYHLPEYVNLEATRTQSLPEAILITEGEKIFFLPYLLRCCDNLFSSKLLITEVFDVVSPYGYPGFLMNTIAIQTPEFLNMVLQKLKSIFLDKNVCSVFLRLHPILNNYIQEFLPSQDYQIQGETVSINLTLSETEIWHQTRSQHRTHINRCKQAGFIAKIVDYHDYIDEFMFIYYQTMDRVGAKKDFYFDREYFTALSKLNEKIHLCIVELENQVACVGIFTECCDIVQCHLSGTNNDFLKQAPNKLMFDYIRFWAKERGNKFFHFGGGLGATKDSLYDFKAGFSKQTHSFSTMRLITNKEKYLDLVKLRAKILSTQVETLLESKFFPAYRS
ncbi:MAG: GNAT family N-acetyltransferase [Nostocales cyanobacterium ELA583]|jgi:hypothetical protein